jgi:hypothetical protein
VAKRRKRYAVTRKRRVYFKAKRRSRRRSSSVSAQKLVLPAVLYGAGRQYLVNLATPLTSMVPLGQYADEAVLGIAGYYLAKKGRGMMKEVGRSMLIVEAASLGSGLIGGKLGNSVSGGWR